MARPADAARRLRQFANELPVRLNAVKQQANMAMVDRLITDTPVDTSRAESNWLVGLGEKIMVSIQAHFLGKHGSTDAQSQNEAKALARSRIALSKPGEPLYLSNTVTYIVKLDQGSSKQAPWGFTHIALALGRRIIQTLGLQRGRAD